MPVFYPFFFFFLNLLLEAACAAGTTNILAQQQGAHGALLLSCRGMGAVEEHPDICLGQLQPVSFHHEFGSFPRSHAACVSVLAAALPSVYCSESC